MNPRRTLAITARLLAQFRHDHRTLAILFVTPLIVLGLFALLLRTEAVDPRVGLVVEGSDGLPVAIGAALLEADGVEGMEVSSTVQADRLLRAGELDGYVVLRDADAEGVLRPAIVLEGTEQRHLAVVPASLQQAAMRAVADHAPPLPPGAPPLTLPRLEPEVETLYGRDDLDQLDLFGGPFIGLVVFFLVYVVTSVSFLRERSQGTLERLMASPLRRAEIIVGYMLGFTAVALVQAVLVIGFSLGVLDVYNAGSAWLIFAIVVILALAAVNLGIFLSTFARNEFQAVQFIPLVIVPQILLSGLLVPVESQPEWLQVVSNALPLTYAVEGLREVMLRGADLASEVVQLDIAVLVTFAVVAVIAGVATLRRESA